MTGRIQAGRLHRLALLAALPVVSACSDEALMPPTPSAGPMFARYAALGNSITAGIQSGGINDSTQRESYALLLARQMGHTIGETFRYPGLALPGCPPPFANIFTQQRIATIPGNCAFRIETDLFLNNVAFPGSDVTEVLTYFDPDTPLSDTDAYKTLLLGGRTQIEAAALVKPTFVSVWVGNNDVLGSVLAVGASGDPARVTSPTTFAERYGQMMDSLDAIGTIEGGVLIGVVQVVFAPYLTQGRVWEGFEAQFDAATAPLNALDVTEASCLANLVVAPGDTLWVSVPFHYGGPKLAEAQAKIDSVQQGLLPPGNLQPAVIDCATGDVVTVPEMANLAGAVVEYNAAIEAEATERDWLFVDPSDLLETLLAQPGQIRPFPAFDPTDPQHTTAPFGAALSRDGIHPSGNTHVLVANALIQAINTKYGTSIPLVQ